MKITRIVWCLLLVAYWGPTALAQMAEGVNDSLEVDSTEYNHTEADIFWTTFMQLDSLRPIDTSVNFLQNYNPTRQQRYDYLHLGNTGSAHKPLVYEPNRPIGFDLGVHQYDLYLYQKEKLRIHNTKTRLTEADYVLGLTDHQLFNVKHTQNITPNFNAGIDYRRWGSKGLYSNQKTLYSNFDGYLWYQTPNKRYNILGSYMLNKNRVRENGGVVDAFEFGNLLYSNRPLVNTRIPSGSFEADDDDVTLYRSKNNVIMLQHAYDFGIHYTEQVNDSTQIQHFQGQWRLKHRYLYEDVYHVYRDVSPDAGYYNQVLFEEDLTRDSTWYRRHSNRIDFQYLGVKEKTVDTIVYSRNLFNVYVEHSQMEVLQQARLFRNIYGYLWDHNIFTGFEMSSNGMAKQRLFYRFKGDYGASGYNAGDYKASMMIGLRLPGKMGRLSTGFQQSLLTPAYNQLNHISNHYEWQNNFEKISEQESKVNYFNPDWNLELEAAFGNIGNFIYRAADTMPAQLDTTLQRWRFEAVKKWNWKKWHLHNHLVYQTFSNDSVARFPNLWTKNSAFFQDRLFEKNFITQVGFDVRWLSSYAADAYDPATGQFFQQNNFIFNYYPIIDFFIKIKVSKTRIFFMVENLGQYWLGNGYMLAPGYPANDLTIKFGLNWRFLD